MTSFFAYWIVNDVALQLCLAKIIIIPPATVFSLFVAEIFVGLLQYICEK